MHSEHTSVAPGDIVALAALVLARASLQEIIELSFRMGGEFKEGALLGAAIRMRARGALKDWCHGFSLSLGEDKRIRPMAFNPESGPLFSRLPSALSFLVESSAIVSGLGESGGRDWYRDLVRAVSRIRILAKNAPSLGAVVPREVSKTLVAAAFVFGDVRMWKEGPSVPAECAEQLIV